MKRLRFLGTLFGFGIASRALGAELFSGDGRTTPAPILPVTPVDPFAGLRERRELQISRVQAYADASQFPRNLDFRGRRVPYFVDDRGVPCAVANLMIQDGLQGEVDEIVRTNNHVRVMDVSQGALVDWVLGSGLLQEEAARIQPSYDFERPYPVPTPVIEDPAVVRERERIRRHLGVVIAELRTSTNTSLPIAARRLAISGIEPSFALE